MPLDLQDRYVSPIQAVVERSVSFDELWQTGNDLSIMASGDQGTVSGGFAYLLFEDIREAPRYSQVFGSRLPRKCFTVHNDYSSYIKGSDQTGVLRRELLTLAHLVPLHIRLVFTRKYVGERNLDDDQLLPAVQEYASYIVNGEDPSRHLEEEVFKAATIRPGGGSAGARVEARISTLENNYLQNLHRHPCNARPMPHICHIWPSTFHPFS